MSEDDSSEPHTLVQLLQQVTPTPIRRSFTIKLGLVLALMAVSIGGVGFFATEKISAETQDRVEQRIENVTREKAGVVAEWRFSNRVTTQQLSSSSDWTGGGGEEMTDRLTTARQDLTDDVYQLHVVEVSEGESSVVASTSSEPNQPITGITRPYIQNSSNVNGMAPGEVYVSDTYMLNEQAVVGFVSPVPGESNRYFVLEASLRDIRQSLGVRGGRQAQIVNSRTNEVVMSEDPVAELSPYAEDEDTLEPVRRAEQLRENGTASGVIAKMPGSEEVVNEPYTVGYAPIEDSEWVAIVYSPQSAEFGFVNTISDYGLYATIFAVLIIGIAGAVIGYSTSTAIDRLTGKTEQMRDGDLDVDLTTTRIDNIGQLYDGFAEMRDELKEQINEAEQARKEAEVSRAEALELSNHLEEQAEEYSEVMQQCAAGDFTQRMTPDDQNDSMDHIATEFNEMMTELEKTVGQLKSYVDEVETAGSEVEQSATTVRTASEQVADAIQTIAVDADAQRDDLQALLADVDWLTENIETADDGELIKRLDGVQTELNEILELSEGMQSEADTISAAAEEQAAELTEVSERANDLQRYAMPLREILDRFETEAEHEFVFSVGPTSMAAEDEE